MVESPNSIGRSNGRDPGATSLRAQTGKIEVLWLGQAATRITTVSGKVDLILVTHAHGDHLGDGPALARKHNAPLWGPPGLAQSLVTLGVLPAELAPRMNKGGVIIPLGRRNPATGKDETHVGGEPVGFIIEFENRFKLYHMGDTGLFAYMKFIGEYYKPDLIMIPIGGHFVMSPKDAAYATSQYLKPTFAIPIHYGTFPVLEGTPPEYMQALGSTSTKVFPINPGDSLSF